MLLEVLDGIGGWMIYLEQEEYSRREDTLQNILKNQHKIYRENEYVIIRTGKLLESPEIDSLEMKINSEYEERMKRSLKVISCLCGCSKKEVKSILRLPSDGWEELVDMWSCHNREFSHLTEQEMRPKKEGVLYSTLYLTAEVEKAPDCLVKKYQKIESDKLPYMEMMKIFYNEVSTGLPDEYFLFHYLYDIFQTRQEILLEGEYFYSVRLIDVTYTYEGEPVDNPLLLLTLKVLYKKITAPENRKTPEKKDENINHYYTNKLIQIIEKNRLNIEIKDRKISFIRRIE